MDDKPIAYEVTVAGTVYRCRGVSVAYESMKGIIGISRVSPPPNTLTLKDVHQIGAQHVTCPEVKLPLMDHTIRPVQ